MDFFCKKKTDTDGHDLVVNYLDIFEYVLCNFDSLNFLNLHLVLILNVSIKMICNQNKYMYMFLFIYSINFNK